MAAKRPQGRCSPGSRVFLLPTCTNGCSVDNAVHKRMLKAGKVLRAVRKTEVDRPVMIIPGPACLLPLFLLDNRDLWS